MTNIEAMFAKLDRMGLRPMWDGKDKYLATQADIERLETQFGHKFPEAYSAFLLRYGICHFKHLVHYPVKGDYSEVNASGDWDEVSIIYGIDPRKDILSLEREIELSREHNLPHYFLPILETDGLARVVYISSGQQDHGRVCLLKRETIWDVMEGAISTQEAEEAAFHIADSFEEFVELLYMADRDSL